MDIQELLCCPSCKGKLDNQNGALICQACDTTYHVENGIPLLVPRVLSQLKDSEGRHYTEHLDFYLEWQQAWEGSPFYQHCHKELHDDLKNLPPGSLILELGCGLGVDGVVLQREGYRVVETDISLGQLKEARRSQHEAGFSEISSHVLADSESIPFADTSFDGVLMVASLHHLENPLAALREIRRVLKDNGIFVLGAELNSWQHKTIFPVGKIFLKLLYRLMKKADPTDLVSEGDQLTTGFSHKQLTELLSDAGFARIELKPAGYLAAAVFFISTELTNLLGRKISLFPLEKVSLSIDEKLAKFRPVASYPWHWNAVAIK